MIDLLNNLKLFNHVIRDYSQYFDLTFGVKAGNLPECFKRCINFLTILIIFIVTQVYLQDVHNVTVIFFNHLNRLVLHKVFSKLKCFQISNVESVSYFSKADVELICYILKKNEKSGIKHRL